jgi:hypothetical protein
MRLVAFSLIAARTSRNIRGPGVDCVYLARRKQRASNRLVPGWMIVRCRNTPKDGTDGERGCAPTSHGSQFAGCRRGGRTVVTTSGTSRTIERTAATTVKSVSARMTRSTSVAEQPSGVINEYWRGRNFIRPVASKP